MTTGCAFVSPSPLLEELGLAPRRRGPEAAVQEAFREAHERLREDGPLAEERAACEASLLTFIERGWHVVEPATEFVPGRHLEATAEHLEAVTRGEILRLGINMPPRHMKSLSVSVFWPAWVWTQKPWVRWLFTSYSGDLSTEHSVACRRLIQSSWYRERWGHVFQFTGDQNRKTVFENDARGYRIASSVGGSATGRGGDVIVADDPHNVKKAESETDRAMVIDWWDRVMSTRLNDPQTGAKVIVMQRVHQDDLMGHVLEQEGYELLKLPAEYEGEKNPTSLGWSDWREEPGELLWPDRFPREAIDDLKATLGSYAAAGQLQQEPVPREGGMFKRAYFRFLAPEAMPPALLREGRPLDVRYWDKAGTADGGDWTAGVRMRLCADDVLLITDVQRGRWEAGERERIFSRTLEADGPPIRQYEEQEPGSAGKDRVLISSRQNQGYSVRGHKPTGSKEVRADPLAAWGESHAIHLVRAAWNRAFIDEMCLFPRGRHDDQVDGASGAFGRLIELRGVDRKPASPSVSMTSHRM